MIQGSNATLPNLHATAARLHQRAKLRECALQLAFSRGVGYHPDEELVPGGSEA